MLINPINPNQGALRTPVSSKKMSKSHGKLCWLNWCDGLMGGEPGLFLAKLHSEGHTHLQIRHVNSQELERFDRMMILATCFTCIRTPLLFCYARSLDFLTKIEARISDVATL